MSSMLMARAAEVAAADAEADVTAKLQLVDDTIRRQAEEASNLHRLWVGEIYYFYPVLGETVQEAVLRLRPAIQSCQRRHDCRLLTKINGGCVRVRMMPRNGATGRLAEWHNLWPGQSVNIFENLTDRELQINLAGAFDNGWRLRQAGKGKFEVQHINDLYLGNSIHVTRLAYADRPGIDRDRPAGELLKG